MKYEDDPVIKRIRDARHKISEKFGHDPRRLVAHYIELQKKHADRLSKFEILEREPTEKATK
jgi:hypothetical protein